MNQTPANIMLAQQVELATYTFPEEATRKKKKFLLVVD